MQVALGGSKPQMEARGTCLCYSGVRSCCGCSSEVFQGMLLHSSLLCFQSFSHWVMIRPDCTDAVSQLHTHTSSHTLSIMTQKAVADMEAGSVLSVLLNCKHSSSICMLGDKHMVMQPWSSASLRLYAISWRVLYSSASHSLLPSIVPGWQSQQWKSCIYAFRICNKSLGMMACR